MADKILHKRSNTVGSIPTTSSIDLGEIAINTNDGKIFIHKSSSAGESIQSVLITDSTNTGSLTLLGSLILSGSLDINSGSSLDISANFIDFDFDLFALSGSLEVTGSVAVTQGITGSLFGTASWANQSTSASYAPFTPTAPGGLNTQIQFNSASVFSGSSNLVFDYTNNRLGIGTNSPSESFHLKGTGSGVAGRTWLRIENTQTDSAAGIQLVNGNGRFASFQYAGSSYIAGEFFAVYTQNDYPLLFATNGGSSGGTSYIAFSPGFNERMRITNGGNVLIGTTTDAGFKLDINGTTRSQGALTVVSGGIALTFNQNNSTNIDVTNTTSGTNSAVRLNLTSTNGALSMGKYSSTTAAYKTVLSNDAFIYTSNAGDISILNDVPAGAIKFTAGGSSTAQCTLTSGGNFLIGTTTNSGYKLNVSGSGNYTNNLTVTGSLNVTAGITGSLFGTASYVTGSIFTSVNPVLSASYAETASYALNGGGSSSTTPGGPLNSIQFNSASQFSGSGKFTYNEPTNTVTLSGSFVNVTTTGASNLDTNTRKLYGQNTSESIDWGARRALADDGNTKIWWADNRNQLFGENNDGNNYDVSLDWQNRFLYDSSDGISAINKQSINYGGRRLLDSIEQTSADWETRTLSWYDGSQNRTIIDWQNFLLQDNIESQSVDWGNRRLSDKNGSTSLDYGDLTISDGVRLYGTASLALAAESLTNGATVSGSFSIEGVGIVTGSFIVSGSSTFTNIGPAIFSGSVTLNNSVEFSPVASNYNGEIVKFGSGTLTTGQLYFLSSSGTWSLSDASTTGSSTGMLGIAVGSSPTTDGLLVRGYANSGSFTQSTGSILYMATSSGIFTETAPSSSGHVVRVIGYKTTISNTIYFMPDATWVTLA